MMSAAAPSLMTIRTCFTAAASVPAAPQPALSSESRQNGARSSDPWRPRSIPARGYPCGALCPRELSRGRTRWECPNYRTLLGAQHNLLELRAGRRLVRSSAWLHFMAVYDSNSTTFYTFDSRDVIAALQI